MKQQRLTFSSYLSEFRSGRLTPIDVTTLHTFLADENNLTLMRAHVPYKHGALSLFKYDLGAKHQRCYLLADRITKEPAAYMMTQHVSGIVWQVIAVEVLPTYQKQGIGTNLYATVLRSDNIKLMNGTQVSPNAERLWTNLKQVAKVSIIDRKTMKTYSLSDIGTAVSGATVLNPKDDDASDEEQRWFYLAEGRYERFPAHEALSSDDYENARYERWLAGEDSFPPFKGPFYGEDDDF